MGLIRRLALVAGVTIACSREPVSSAARPFAVDTFATPETVPFERPVIGLVLPDKRVAILDYQANRVFLLSASGAVDTTLGGPGSGPGELQTPTQLALRGDTLAVLNGGNVRVENYLLSGHVAPSTSLPAIVQSRETRLLPGDSLLVSTGGSDSALAVLQDRSGTTLVRYARPLVPPSSMWDFEAMRAEILSGKMPDRFRNVATPIPGNDGEVWLVEHTEGKVAHYSASGDLLGETILPDSELAPIRAAFFAANAAEKRPGVLRSYFVATSGTAIEHDLWLLLNRPDSLAAVLLRLDRTGAIVERHELPGAEGARRLVSTGNPDLFYAIHPTEGLVFRLARSSRYPQLMR